jgi:hypothetical protein
LTRRARLVAWIVLLALAAYQAYAQRYAIGPDGMAYLDLSDAVTRADWHRLFDLYWSPAYPFLIGVARLISGAGPRGEIEAIHAVNFACYVGLLAAFEYFLTPVLRLSARVRGSALSKRWGAAAAYAFFGVLALAMTPLELTTPDLLSDAAILVAFGALLRLREPARHSEPFGRLRSLEGRLREESAIPAVVLGLALGIGALTKSFLVPWAVVCLVTVGLMLGRRGTRQIAIASGVWAAFVIPLSIGLSIKAGRPTFGDAGRLTFAWYVNLKDPPSMGGVPPGARTPATEKILPGVGVPGDSPYADPMWADPERYNRAVAPHFSVSDQIRTLKVFHVFYVENLTPLLFLIFVLVVAPTGTRRSSWWLGWPVYVPSIAGLFAYAMVLVTTRYVMPFVLAITLVMLATIPIARRLRPLHALMGFAIIIALEALLPETLAGLALVASILAGVLTAVLVSSRRTAVWILVTVIGLLVARVIFLPSFASLVRVGAIGVAVLYWRASLAAVRAQRAVWFAERSLAALALVLALVLGFRTWIRLNQDRTAFARAERAGWNNPQWNIAQDLATRGVAPDTRIAIIGPHAEAYWARTARVHIVANVPRNRVVDFWALPKPAQDSLLGLFRASGATVAIATMAPASGLDSSWTPLTYHGWMRQLK